MVHVISTDPGFRLCSQTDRSLPELLGCDFSTETIESFLKIPKESNNKKNQDFKIKYLGIFKIQVTYSVVSHLDPLLKNSRYC